MTRRLRSFLSLACAALGGIAIYAEAQVTPERILRAAEEPQNWLTYSGGYASQRYTTLRQVTPQNVGISSRNGCCRAKCSARGSPHRSS